MASLREVKDRIASVRSTLKITSAMKLVASSKLRRAQRAIEALRPYEETLGEILAAAAGAPDGSGSTSRGLPPKDFASLIPPTPDGAGPSHSRGHGRPRPSEAIPDAVSPLGDDVVILSERSESKNLLLAFSSNSSMCGAFNANVIKKALELVRKSDGGVETWAFGRKMAEALRKEGLPTARDFTHLVAHPSFDAVAAVSAELRERYAAGEISGAMLVYNHFVSTGRQEVVVEPYFEEMQSGVAPEDVDDEEFILEPSRSELLESLMPQVLDLKLYAALLDSAAAEHAARMIAMQTATDNAEELLGELTLEYNKGRQQKITAEILDLVGAEA